MLASHSSHTLRRTFARIQSGRLGWILISCQNPKVLPGVSTCKQHPYRRHANPMSGSCNAALGAKTSPANTQECCLQAKSGCDTDLCVGPPKILCYPVIVGGPSKEDLLWVILMEVEIENSCEITIRTVPWEQGICTPQHSSWDSPLQLLLQRGSKHEPRIHLASAW